MTPPTAAPASALVRAATLMLAFTSACLPLYIVRFKYGPLSTTLLEGLACIAATTHPNLHPPHPELIQLSENRV